MTKINLNLKFRFFKIKNNLLCGVMFVQLFVFIYLYAIIKSIIMLIKTINTIMKNQIRTRFNFLFTLLTFPILPKKTKSDKNDKSRLKKIFFHYLQVCDL